MTSTWPFFSSTSRSLRPKSRTTVFSFVFLWPMAPGSIPPCPGSMTTSLRPPGAWASLHAGWEQARCRAWASAADGGDERADRLRLFRVRRVRGHWLRRRLFGNGRNVVRLLILRGIGDGSKRDVLVGLHHGGERILAGLHQIDNDPGGLACLSRDNKRLLDEHGSGGVKNNARTTLLHGSISVFADEPARLLASIGWQIETDIRQVDHHPVGIGQHIDRVAHGLAQVRDEAGPRLVTRYPRGLGDHLGRDDRRRLEAGKQEEQRQHDDSQHPCRGRAGQFGLALRHGDAGSPVRFSGPKLGLLRLILCCRLRRRYHPGGKACISPTLPIKGACHPNVTCRESAVVLTGRQNFARSEVRMRKIILPVSRHRRDPYGGVRRTGTVPAAGTQGQSWA